VTDRTEGISERAQRLHDLRQPLAAILAAASALRSNIVADPVARERLLNIIAENAERLAEMLDDPSAND